VLHQTTLNQPQNKKYDLATFSSLPLHPQKWQRIIDMATSTDVGVGAASGMKEAIAQVSGSSLDTCILFLYFQLFIIVYCTYI
jgi:hypothetical protein